MARTGGPDTPGRAPGAADSGAAAAQPARDRPAPTDRWMADLNTLLQELQDVAGVGTVPPPVLSDQTDNQLVQVRLGTAASLFAALQCKHAETAGHALRVALSCSAWSGIMGLHESQRDVIEVAALLHDIGLIGAPDQILLKPGKLDWEEAAIIGRARQMGTQILRHSCASPEILEIVEHVGAWYDGTRKGFRLSGQDIPFGARMIAVVEAFDAMTTDHVYRPAMSHERAISELFHFAGRQFDLELVERFAEFTQCGQPHLRQEVARRWLRSLDPEMVNSCWQLNCIPSPVNHLGSDVLFQAKLLDNMYDAVVFIDAAMRVALWNRGAERLTGIAGSSVSGRQWQPSLLEMCDERGHAVSEADCPVGCTIRSGVQSLRRLVISGRSGRPVAVDTHSIPVTAEDGSMLGAILLFHDASSETSLEQRCQSLHQKATLDPLTEVANRAEFDRVHEMFVAAHLQQGVPCSLMICDLDHFKQVNDTYGHQAGDEVIKSLAALLKASCRPGDLVARYGGEEFVVLCAGCDNAAAARRAEHVRKALSQIPQPKMGGHPVTVSFGVTEIQPGDTPETMLRRADRALLLAKNKGRNTVVQLGAGSEAPRSILPGRLWPATESRPQKLLERTLVTSVPIQVAIEKLRGFVADHQAKIVQIDGNHLQLEIADRQRRRARRLTDRPIIFSVDLRFEEERLKELRNGRPLEGILRTRIHVTIAPRSKRDRRRDEASERAQRVMASFRSYLMAAEEDQTARKSVLRQVKRLLAPWLTRRRSPPSNRE